jgi:hypothetical protein
MYCGSWRGAWGREDGGETYYVRVRCGGGDVLSVIVRRAVSVPLSVVRVCFVLVCVVCVL